MKYIFITGGVASSLGKGILAASLGKLLQARGYNVINKKLDPYLNIDPGTLNPYEHGECFVTADGHVADLDLGHYERFLNIETTRNSNVTTGRIYQSVINKERAGAYKGKTVQVIPHITDEIKSVICAVPEDAEVAIVEIGGTIGDIEGLPYIEAVRQLRWELPNDTLCIHLTYVPYLKAAGELKTKPTQHSVKALQELGVQPDIVVLRTEYEIDSDLCRKVALFCNVTSDAVIPCMDASTIYEVPLLMQQEDLDGVVLRKLGLTAHGAHLEENGGLQPWCHFLERYTNAKEEVHIALIGKYVQLQDAYKSLTEALLHAAVHHDRRLKLTCVLSDDLTPENVAEQLAGFDGAVIGGAFGYRGSEGKILAAQYLREHNIPCLGIGMGMQCMAIEFARNVLGISDATSEEFMTEAGIKQPTLVITSDGDTSMRLGAYNCRLIAGSKMRQAYDKEVIRIRHRHRYEFNRAYVAPFAEAGFLAVGMDAESGLVEVLEHQQNSFHIGVLGNIEYSSRVLFPEKIFMAFISSAIQ